MQYGNAAAIAGGSSVPEARQPEVQQEFSRVEETAVYIEKITEELELKLTNSILAMRAETGNVGQTSPEPVRVPVAQRLYDLGTKLEHIRRQLDSILGRIEA